MRPTWEHRLYSNGGELPGSLSPPCSGGSRSAKPPCESPFLAATPGTRAGAQVRGVSARVGFGRVSRQQLITKFRGRQMLALAECWATPMFPGGVK